jgi:hypothetical protein
MTNQLHRISFINPFKSKHLYLRYRQVQAELINIKPISGICNLLFTQINPYLACGFTAGSP